ncbi:MAG: Zn-dependent hydrolase [Chloroflexales bacterium]
MSDDLARRVMDRCDALGAISEDLGRLTRRSLTPAMRTAHDLAAGWMRAAGMAVHEDNVGNLVGTYPADRSVARTLILGSHLDTVRDAGRYDGILGVLVGLAAVERLHRAGRRLPFAVEVVAFTEEEGLRFPAFLGSRTVAGSFDPSALDRCDDDGVTLAEAIRAFGGEPDMIPQDARRRQDLLGYLEVHIEQGPLLEQRGLPVGVVSAITGLSRGSLTFTGVAGHAGTVPMEMRRDALCAAAEFVLAAEFYARGAPGLVATVGQITVSPGASNVIPGAVTVSLDLRDQDEFARLAGLAELRRRAEGVAVIIPTSSTPPRACVNCKCTARTHQNASRDVNS